uniref:Defensin beta 126 n=1 Tax=Piliocolobus tephrosceles TaxID=591936 RepID=A0A8C9GCM0_9PRIM
MKSLLFTLAVFMLLAQLVSGNLYVKRCLNDIGICKKTCKPEEVVKASVMCGKHRACCVPADKRSAYPSFCARPKTTRTSTVTATATTTTTTTLMSLMTTMAASPVSPTT